MPEEIRLHLGAGDARLEGWINVDTRMQPGIDRVDNIGILKRYAPGSVAAIYASHCLDHFSRWDYPRVLRRWHELLQPEGTLKLSVIDFAAIVKLYGEGISLTEMRGALVAAQDYESNVRHMHWDFRSLDQDLRTAGFRTVVRFVPFHEDCSRAHFRGFPVSLNVCATK